MNTYSIKSEDFQSVDLFQELQRICSVTVDKISSISPSDNNVDLQVAKEGDQFWAAIKVSSQQLNLFSRKLANSPFMAIAAAASDTMDKVQKWATSR